MGSPNLFKPKMVDEICSATNPTLIPNNTDDDTGIGRASFNQLSLIAGGVEGIRVNDAEAHSVAGIANYETLVTNDDDIPNKKFVDDSIEEVKRYALLVAAA